MGEHFYEQRVDNAKTKRVELHNHTKISRQDAVVNVKDLILTAYNWGWNAIAITDHASVQAFPEAMKTVEKYNLNIKIIYGMEGYLSETSETQINNNHITILVKNLKGLHNLYKLVTLSYQHYFRKPRIPRQLLEQYREGLIIGSSCSAGELIKAIVAGKDEKKLLEIAGFYDFLEMQPIASYDYALGVQHRSQNSRNKFLRDINLKIIELAKKLGKIAVATGDTHFLNPKDAVCRAALMYGKGVDIGIQPPLFLHTTQEMLDAFDYLSEKLAYEVVVTNSRIIEEMIEPIKPVSSRLRYTTIPFDVNEEIMERLKHTFGSDKIFYAGVIQKISEKTAEKYAKNYLQEKYNKVSDKFTEQIAKGIYGVKRYTGAGNRDFVIVSNDAEITDFTPLQTTENGVVITHFDFKDLVENKIEWGDIKDVV